MEEPIKYTGVLPKMNDYFYTALISAVKNENCSGLITAADSNSAYREIIQILNDAAGEGGEFYITHFSKVE